MNMPSERETVNLLDQLRESDRKLTEALLEIAHPNKIDAFENPYDGDMAAEASKERPEMTDIGELRRRLYVAERHGFVKLAAMWRRLIEKEQVLDEYQAEIRETHTGDLDE